MFVLPLGLVSLLEVTSVLPLSAHLSCVSVCLSALVYAGRQVSLVTAAGGAPEAEDGCDAVAVVLTDPNTGECYPADSLHQPVTPCLCYMSYLRQSTINTQDNGRLPDTVGQCLRHTRQVLYRQVWAPPTSSTGHSSSGMTEHLHMCQPLLYANITFSCVGQVTRLERNEAGSFYRVFQPNKWRLKKQAEAEAAQKAAAEAAAAAAAAPGVLVGGKARQ